MERMCTACGITSQASLICPQSLTSEEFPLQFPGKTARYMYVRAHWWKPIKYAVTFDPYDFQEDAIMQASNTRQSWL